MTRTSLALTALAFAAGAAVWSAAPANAALLTGANGMTLYTYDNDAGGKPTCNGFCAIAWPPYVSNGEKMGAGWTTVQRANGSLQWAYKGKPVYFYQGDRAKGDAKGNGAEGIWHVVNQ